MRHNARIQHFGRRADARKALVRGLVYSLVEHGRIQTTVAKAKELRRHAERAVTLAKQGTLEARRLLLSRFPNEKTVQTLIEDLGKRFSSRPGGYTRVIKLGKRVGDKAEMAFIEWVDYQLPTKAADEAEAGGKKKTAKKAAGGAKKKTAKKAAAGTAKKKAAKKAE